MGDQRGSATVEFALVLPLLAMFAFGVVDMGRAYRLKTRLTNAAREGSTYAQFFPAQVTAGVTCVDPNNVEYAATHEEGLSNGFSVNVTNASSGGVPITGCNLVTVPASSYVTVTVSAPFRPLTPILSVVIGSSRTVSAVSEVVVQG